MTSIEFLGVMFRRFHCGVVQRCYLFLANHWQHDAKCALDAALAENDALRRQLVSCRSVCIDELIHGV